MELTLRSSGERLGLMTVRQGAMIVVLIDITAEL
jgi:hypothetical protein